MSSPRASRDRGLRARIRFRFVQVSATGPRSDRKQNSSLGSRLADYPHQRLTGCTEYWLRAGDYRVIYEFDREWNIGYLTAVGNRTRFTAETYSREYSFRSDANARFTD